MFKEVEDLFSERKEAAMTAQKKKLAEAEAAENHEAFLARLRPLLAPSELRRVEAAYNLAKAKHRGQERKERDTRGVPVRYFEHLRAVALILIDVIGCVEPDMICAALLHDSLEDTTLTPDSIEHQFGTEVARLVIRLTKNPKEGYVERLSRHGTWRELVLKGCDHLHNRRTLQHGELDWQRKQIRETETYYFPLLTRLLDIVPTQYHRGVLELRDEMHGLIATRKAALGMK